MKNNTTLLSYLEFHIPRLCRVPPYSLIPYTAFPLFQEEDYYTDALFGVDQVHNRWHCMHSMLPMVPNFHQLFYKKTDQYYCLCFIQIFNKQK